MREYLPQEIKKEKDKLASYFKNSILYIDSNVYMTEEANGFFIFISEDLFKIKNYDINIIMLKEQYTEMYKIKKNKDNQESAKSARDAFRLIEELQEDGCITIENLDIESNAKSYADPILIKRIISHLKNNENVIFVTFDSDLKIRLREQIKQNNLNRNLLKILSFKDIEFLDVEQLIEEGAVYCNECEEYVFPLEDTDSDTEDDGSMFYIYNYIINYCPKCENIFNKRKVSTQCL